MVTLGRHTHWSADDVFRRADFSIQCAFAHGTKVIRTHVDSFPPQDEISWPVVLSSRKVGLQGCDTSSGLFVTILIRSLVKVKTMDMPLYGPPIL